MTPEQLWNKYCLLGDPDVIYYEAFMEVIEEIAKQEYERGFIDGAHATGVQAEEIMAEKVEEARMEEREKWEKKTIIIPKGKAHPVHDRCEDCIEIGKTEGKKKSL